ncbi:MAG: hypothetical protein Q8910_15225 [Bacteroidota bacterium]|nr:hypothetical protein [Bacteroidota bacterium]
MNQKKINIKPQSRNLFAEKTLNREIIDYKNLTAPLRRGNPEAIHR